MILLIVYLLIALLVSFLCSVMESALLSTPNTFLLARQDDGRTWVQIFIGHKKDIDRPLSAILSLNTVAHTIGAAGVGAQATMVFGEAYFGVISVVLTLLILVLSEIIPKTIGARYWRGLARITAYTIRGMIWITYPLVWISGLITKAISGDDNEKSTSREEIAALTKIGAAEGIFNKNENLIIQNVLLLRNVKVREIMTPRIVVAMVDEKTELRSFLNDKRFVNFSRIPLIAGGADNITGYVLRQDAFEKMAVNGGNELLLADLKRDIVVVPDIKPVFSVWQMLLERKEHIAAIVDEYGGFSGIVTMEDIIETILGLEIIDEKDSEADMQEYARKRWEMKQAKFHMYNEYGPDRE